MTSKNRLPYMTNSLAHCVLLVLTTVLSVVFYSRDHPSDQTLRVQEWSLSVEPCSQSNEAMPVSYLRLGAVSYPGAVSCVPSQQDAMPPLGQRLNCTANSHSHGALGDTQNGVSALCMLSGQSYLYDRLATNLFSSVDVVFLCLASQVLVVGIAIGDVSEAYMAGSQQGSDVVLYGEYTKRGGMWVLVLYSISALVMQNAWGIPMNNLLVFEGLVGMALLLIALGHKLHSSVTQSLFSLPLLAVAVMAALGVSTSSAMTTTAGSIVLSHVMMLWLEDTIEKTSDGSGGAVVGDSHSLRGHSHKRPKHAQKSKDEECSVGVCSLTSWVALVPVLVELSIALDCMRVGIDAGYPERPWAVAAAVLLLAHILCVQLICTVYFHSSMAWFTRDDLLELEHITAVSCILLCLLLGSLASLDP